MTCSLYFEIQILFKKVIADFDNFHLVSQNLRVDKDLFTIRTLFISACVFIIEGTCSNIPVTLLFISFTDLFSFIFLFIPFLKFKFMWEQYWTFLHAKTVWRNGYQHLAVKGDETNSASPASCCYQKGLLPCLFWTIFKHGQGMVHFVEDYFQLDVFHFTGRFIPITF